MKRFLGALVLVSGVAGCADFVRPVATPAPPSPPSPAEQPQLPPPPPPAPTARTEEQFDTTTQAQRQAALETAPVASSSVLGTTVASLGNPAEPGFWLKTPLVDAEQAGQVRYQGQTAAVTLRPIEGPDTAGSRLSLAAMRLLMAPLTELVEIEVSTP